MEQETMLGQSIRILDDPPKAYRNTITRYRMTEENMVGLVREPAEHYDLMTVIMLCLGGAKSENYGGILKLLDVLLSSEIKFSEKQDILRQDFDLAMTTQLEQEVRSVCNLSEGVWERGMKSGIEAGMKKGLQEGLTEAIRSVMANLGLGLEQAMTALNIPEPDRPIYRELLQKQQ